MTKPKIIAFCLTRRGCIEYAESMVSLLPDVIVVTSSYSKFKAKYIHYTIRTYVNSIDFLIRTTGFIFSCYFLLKRLVKENGKSLIFYFPVYHPWNLIISLYSMVFKIKTVVTVHDYVQHIGEENIASEWIQRKTIKTSSKTVFLSQSELNKVNDLNLKLKSIVIPHPILHLFDQVPSRSHQLNPDILFFGRISSYKGVDILLNSFDDYKSVIGKLTIAGDIVDQGLRIRHDQNINVINNYIPENKVKELLSSHHILILPYVDASQSGVLTLGIDSCIPMIISDLPGLREQLDDSCAYWVKPGSSDDITKAIEWYSIKENYENVVQKLFLFRAGQNQEVGKKLLCVLYKW